MNASESVTVVVTRRIKAGKEDAYKKWVAGVTAVSKSFPGHLGATLNGPGENNEYNIIFRYDSLENLKRWDTSEERKTWTAELNELVQGSTVVTRYSGLEFLFDAPTQLQLPKYAMTTILIFVVYSVLLLVQPIVKFLFSGYLGEMAQLFVAISIQITIINYLIMPCISGMIGYILRRKRRTTT